MDEKHPKENNLRWTAEALYKLIENGEDRRTARNTVFTAGSGPAGEPAVDFGSGFAVLVPDDLTGDAELFDDEGDDSLFGDGDGDYLFSGADGLYSGGIGDGGLYGGVDDSIIAYNPSNASDGDADVDFLLVKDSGGVNIGDFRAADAQDDETSNTDVIIYGENVAGLTSLEALAEIGISVNDGKISVGDHDNWIWGAGNAHGGYTTFTGSDKDGHKLTVEVPTADLKKAGTAE
jgi:hypothetical protein